MMTMISLRAILRQYSADNHCDISWSGVNLEQNKGWNSLGGGSLFVKSKFGFNPFKPDREFRTDVEKRKKNEFVYNNGNKIGSKWDVGIYHIIFPYAFLPVQIRYPLMSDIEIIHCRIMDGRAIITWVFKKQLQLEITMQQTDIDSKKFRLDTLYKATIENMPEEALSRSELLKDMKKSAINNILSIIPKIFSAI
jgi:hypothetical protein